jgi:hypothetical protein
MKKYEGVDVQIHTFLTSALFGDVWSASRPSRFTPEEKAPGTLWIGGWLDLVTGTDNVEKRKILPLPGFEIRPLRRPARSQPLYRLPYPEIYLKAALFIRWTHTHEPTTLYPPLM